MEGWIWLILASYAVGVAFGDSVGVCAFFVLGFIGWCFGRPADEIEKLRELLERDE